MSEERKPIVEYRLVTEADFPIIMDMYTELNT